MLMIACPAAHLPTFVGHRNNAGCRNNGGLTGSVLYWALREGKVVHG